MKALLFLYIASLPFVSSDLFAQRMDIKKYLGFDFNYSLDEAVNYYELLGSSVIRDISDDCPPASPGCAPVRSVTLSNTPLILSVPTSYLHLGAVEGKLAQISIIINERAAWERFDAQLARTSKGKAHTERHDGAIYIHWVFENCIIRKSEVLVEGDDSTLYRKYDILQR
ncbi:MAG: hypothetical protein CL946_13525 [Ectothiorhodospiraceae bacterium]|nr:hypothetical protein [Ectothiorhodospiraceae bacterium]